MPKTKPSPVADGGHNRRATGDLRAATAWIDVGLWRAIKVYAVHHDTTLSELVAEAIRRHLAPLVNDKKRSNL